MRLLSASALTSALLTLTAAVALRAADATLAVVAVAAITVLLAWYAQLHATPERSALGLVNPASALSLAVVGRRPWSTLLPTIAAHAVGAIAGGIVVLALDDHLGDTLVFGAPGLVTAAVGASVVGLVGAWATLAVDGGGHEGLASVPVLVGGAALPLGLLTAFHPAAVLGLATAGLVPWDVAAVASLTVLAASVAGAYLVALLVPSE
jgi:hypothetical protein